MKQAKVGRRRWPVWLAGSSAGLAVVLGTLWIERAPIAENFIGRELTQRGARARYDLVSVGLRTQRIEHLVLGDPADPDLTADWAEIDIAFAGISPSVAAVRAGGVRMRGRLHDGRLTLGELDKFRTAGGKQPFSLPDLKLGLADARMRLDSDFGVVGLKLDGSGNLRSGFAGKLAAVMPRAMIGGCSGESLTAFVDISTHDGRPRLVGPLRSAQVDCPGTGRALKTEMAVDLLLGDRFDSWSGKATGRADAMQGAGTHLQGPAWRLQFQGDSRRTAGHMSLTAAGFSATQGGAQQLAVDSSFGFSGGVFTAEGTVSARDVRLVDADPLAGLRTSMRATPLAPLAVKLADAVRGAGRSNRFSTGFSLRQSGVRLVGASFVSGSGARLRLGEGSGLNIDWSGKAPMIDGRLAIEGGGLPHAALALRGSGTRWAGQLFLDDYRAGEARLAAREIRFAPTSGGATRFAGDVTLDGPLPDGFVRGLTLPLSGLWSANGALWLNPDCTPVGISELGLSTLKLEPAHLSLCPVEGGSLLAWNGKHLTGGAEARDVHLDGTIGSSPLALAAVRAEFRLSTNGFSVADLNVTIGRPDSPVRLAIAALEGISGANGLSGTLKGGAGRIGTVPLLLSDAEGKWRFADSRLVVEGGLAVDDSASPVRFERLTTRNMVFELGGANIRATGTLDGSQRDKPDMKRPVAVATIVHDLNSGIGRADLAVTGLSFDQDLQPDDLTLLAKGIVADVRGMVRGAGHIGWTPDGVSSDGTFRTDGLNLDAAFGPVTGLAGEIHFNDLLGLVTPPHQLLTVASINPGVLVTDGKVHYQLLPDSKVQVEDGLWPLAGGQLRLDPTLLDLGRPTARNLTFQVQGLDAAQFLQQFDFENINATGTFDGVLPIVFDSEGGRIVGGRLTARPGGGNLAYLGELTKEDLGYWGNYAFEMLKSLDYRTLTLEMNGNLDGEIVTAIAFTGLRQGEGAQSNRIARQIARLPIHFNVNIRAPFRLLLQRARTFYDPTLLKSDFEAEVRKQQTVKPIQQQESGTMP